MPEQPYTVQFGPWAPDLENVAVQIPYQFGATPVPCADCENIYYQDGAYRSMPSPSAIGPALSGEALLNAFTWYDETSGEEIVFGAQADGVSALANGAWGSVPIINALSVSITGQGIKITEFGATVLVGQGLRLSQGSVGAVGQVFNGTLVAGNISSSEYVHIYGYGDGAGSLTPSTDFNGNVIGAVSFEVSAEPKEAIAYTLELVYETEELAQDYFQSMEFPGASENFTAGSATFGSGTGYTSWTWTGGTGSAVAALASLFEGSTGFLVVITP